jgi:hypothetical protein
MADSIITVDFHDDTLFAVDRGNGDVFVAIAPICRSLGIDPNGQRKRIQDDPVFREGSRLIALPSPGGMQETVCLRLDFINGWLFSVNANRVRAAAQPKLTEYQRECHRVLFEHFYHRARRETPEAATIRANATALNAACRVIDTIRRSLGPRAAAAALPEILAKAGISIPGPHQPPQAELHFDVQDDSLELANVVDIGQGKPSC